MEGIPIVDAALSSKTIKKEEEQQYIKQENLNEFVFANPWPEISSVKVESEEEISIVDDQLGSETAFTAREEEEGPLDDEAEPTVSCVEPTTFTTENTQEIYGSLATNRIRSNHKKNNILDKQELKSSADEITISSHLNRTYSHSSPGNIKHQVVGTGNKPFICSTCNKSFTQKKYLSQHQVVHTGAKPFPCDKCDKSFSFKTNLCKHQLVHTVAKPFTCETCGKGFSRKIGLSKHQAVHVEVKLFTCETCKKSFSCKKYLLSHQVVHTGAKPFTCDGCKKSFSSKGNLSKHQMVHTGVKPFTCDICDKSFTQKGTLTQHQVVHTRIK